MQCFVPECLPLPTDSQGGHCVSGGVHGAEVLHCKSVVGGREIIRESRSDIRQCFPQEPGQGYGSTVALPHPRGGASRKVRLSQDIRCGTKKRQVSAFRAEGECSDAQTGQNGYPGIGEVLRACRRPRERQLQHEIRSAAESSPRTQVRVGGSRLAPLDEAPAHHTYDAHAVTQRSAHRTQQAHVPVMKRIEFADNACGRRKRSVFHRSSDSLLEVPTVYHIPDVRASPPDGFFACESEGCYIGGQFVTFLMLPDSTIDKASGCPYNCT